MEIKPQLLGMEPYQPGKPIEEVKEELGLTVVHKLASNENPYGASPKVKEKVQEVLLHPEIYPDGYAAAIRNKVAEHVGVREEQLIFGAGSDEVILMLCRALLSNETNTVMATPTFSQYKHNALIEGAEIREVPLKEGKHDLEAMLEKIDEKTKIVWVCNPNNPTGTYTTTKEFESFLERVPKDVLVVSDEAYLEYVSATDYPNTIPYLDEYPNLMILRTFSKAYGLAALRIGYGIGNASFIRSLDPVRPPFNTSSIAHQAAIAALEDQAFIQACKEKNRQVLDDIMAFCEQLGLSYLPTETNFILIETGIDGDVLFDDLLKKGFIVRSGKALGFPHAIRVTAGTKEQNEAFLQAFHDCLEKRKTLSQG